MLNLYAERLTDARGPSAAVVQSVMCILAGPGNEQSVNVFSFCDN